MLISYLWSRLRMADWGWGKGLLVCLTTPPHCSLQSPLQL